MSLRFYQCLLTTTMLVLISACVSTGTRSTGDGRTGKETTSLAITPGSDTTDQPRDFQWDSTGLSLEEINKLSAELSVYQPDRVLEILNALESIPASRLNTMIDSQLYDPEFTEWLELALQVRILLINGGPVAVAAQDWANYHYGHIVNQHNYADLVSRYAAKFVAPSQVAVLLPTEGGLAAAGQAIRDGILSAYLDQPGNTSLRFYASGDSTESAITAFLQAREDGATQVIGPLRAESTRAFANIDTGGIPVLLLNRPSEYLEADLPQANIVNSLSLSQTEEAAALAENALAQGQTRAIVIVPDSPWGNRIEIAFSTVFERGGGSISASAHFDPTTSDHSAMLTQVLKIDESRQRERDLQSRLGIRLVFEPIRREDFDVIFMAANPAQGRELKPLLRFHNAGDIPVYAMSRIFSGKVERGSDQDLNGVIFATTPWQLETSRNVATNLESLRGGAFENLYALGQDAWHLLPWLPLMQKDPDLWFPGRTGSLRLLANGNIFRQPAWAQISAGRPRPYQWPVAH